MVNYKKIKEAEILAEVEGTWGQKYVIGPTGLGAENYNQIDPDGL